MLVNMKELLLEAQKGGYAVGSFSVANMEMVLGVVKAAEEKNVGIILQIAEVRLNFSPLALIGPLMIAAAKRAKVPVAVHLDHGTTLETIKQALELGFTSVMFDGSHLPIQENIRLTNEVVAMAKPFGAAVEAEIGCVGGSEDGSEDIKMRCTAPSQAKEFFEKTNVDALAVAIGNAHGIYKQAPELRIDILEEIQNLVACPLVLHGGSGLTDDDFRTCAKKGISKINIATATFCAVENKVKEAYQSGEISGYYDLHQKEIDGAYENAIRHIDIFYN